MGNFLLQQGKSAELSLFPHIIEFASQKNLQVQIGSFYVKQSNYLSIYFITEGKFEWVIHDRSHTLYPGDTAIVLPGQQFGCENGIMELGAFTCIHIQPDYFDNTGKLALGKWSGISEQESNSIGKLLLLKGLSVVGGFTMIAQIFQYLQKEVFEHELGFATRVNQLIDELLINIVRHFTRENFSRRDFSVSFMKLEQALQQNLDHQWLVEEMAVLVGLGTTAFTEKVKNYTGFSPQHYLIKMRIAEAIKMLKRADKSVTDIALETGFYSSQHFSTTFKKLTGYTPRHFRKNNIKNSHS